MAIIKLYHGTNADFQLLDPTKSRNQLDFGTGCYLTNSISQAWGMAKRKASIFGGTMKVMEFDFDTESLDKPFAKVFDDYSVDWTEYVILNRYFPDYHNEYKIIIGPVADGTIPDDIDDYMSTYPENQWRQESNLQELTKKLIFDNNKKSIQYCFRDQKTINELLTLREIYYEQ